MRMNTNLNQRIYSIFDDPIGVFESAGWGLLFCENETCPTMTTTMTEELDTVVFFDAPCGALTAPDFALQAGSSRLYVSLSGKWVGTSPDCTYVPAALLDAAIRIARPQPRFTFGSDFEYNFVGARGVVSAHDFYSDIAAAPSRRHGWDGNRVTGETRTRVYDSARKLARAIQRDFTYIARFAARHKMKLELAGEYPCGLHVHIGSRYADVHALAEYLDSAFDFGAIQPEARLRSGYGHDDDFYRRQPHGVEWRRPPAVLLESEQFDEVFVRIDQLLSFDSLYSTEKPTVMKIAKKCV